MNWIAYPECKPTASQPYLVSINKPYANGDLTFNYVAYYDTENDRWHKYDGFVDNGIGDGIDNDSLNGWIDNMTTYLG